MVKAVVRGKLTALQAYFQKKKSQINSIAIHQGCQTHFHWGPHYLVVAFKVLK